MRAALSHIPLSEVQQDLVRNIASLSVAQNLFDDLSENPEAQQLAQQVEAAVKPKLYASRQPIIGRPFEDAAWFNAISYPFKNWQASRFSDGSFSVWYGSDSAETSVYETAYHWYHGLLYDAGYQEETITVERKLHKVFCAAALLDFRAASERHHRLLHQIDYAASQAVGARIHREGHPGLIIPSARHPSGTIYAIFNPRVLSRPRPHNCLTYELQGGQITVAKNPGRVWLKLCSTSI
jgi:hypothetical protein